MTPRDPDSERSLQLLGADQFRAFIMRAAEREECRAVLLMREHIVEGDELAPLFRDAGFTLSVRKVDARTWFIEFGCSPLPSIGDGGEWTATFDEDGALVNVAGGGTWIS
jgi:hypothetical protein